MRSSPRPLVTLPLCAFMLLALAGCVSDGPDEPTGDAVDGASDDGRDAADGGTSGPDLGDPPMAPDADGATPRVDAAEPDASSPEQVGDAGPARLDAEARADGSPVPEAAEPLPVCDCFVHVGWCAEGVLEEAAGSEVPCRVPLAEANPGALLGCDGGEWVVREACAHGCAPEPPGTPDACNPPPLPDCPCFVRSAWCGEGATAEGLRRDPACRVPLGRAHADDLLACDGDHWIVREACAFGCFAQPDGVPDRCNSDPAAAPTPRQPGWAPCPSRGLLHYGLHPEASDRLRCAGVSGDRISQTIGNAAASAGYHAADGHAAGEPYCAAVDLRTRDLSNREIRALLTRLGQNGFAAWYRQPGHDGWPGSEAPHIHAVFSGVRMKSQPRGQVRDFLVGRNGLSSHTRYGFWQPAAEILRIIRLLFSRHYDP